MDSNTRPRTVAELRTGMRVAIPSEAYGVAAKALDLLVRLAEFVIPKLARTDLTGDAGGKTPTVIHIVGVEPFHGPRCAAD